MASSNKDEVGFNEALHRKNRIVLSDYDYERDIRHRILMSQLTLFEVSVLCEIVDGSLQTTITELSSTLDSDPQSTAAALSKLEECGLVSVHNDKVSVDKELRRYYETQIEKFDEDFRPGVSYLLDLLKKVPIQFLPSWYPISRTSDDIFASIIQRFLETPKVYKTYLNDLVLDDPILEGIRNTVFSSPKSAVCSRELREQFDLSRAEFEEAMLHLEFNMVCFLSYIEDGDRWREIVTPLHEWTEYLDSQKNAANCVLSDQTAVEECSGEDFRFIQQMAAIVDYLIANPFAIENGSNVPQSIPVSISDALKSDPDSLQKAWDKLLLLNLVTIQDHTLSISQAGTDWHALSTYDRAMAIYRHPQNWSVSWGLNPKLCSERNIRTTEKSLRNLVDKGWIDFETFMNQLTIPIGSSGPVQLKRVRRGRWKFVLPSYSPEERELVYRTIFERLYEVGMVEKGVSQGKQCFKVTTFGQISLGA